MKPFEAMQTLGISLRKLRIWRETRAQDLIEYALLAGFMAVAAGAVLPDIVTSISTIFTTVGTVLTSAIQAN
jgi:pilus assembly protein Flp/PilA